MPRRKVYTEGKRVNVWLPPRHLKDWEELDNKSAFLQLCMDDMVGIMAWGILKKTDPEKYTRPIEKNPPKNLKQEFNKAYPLDPLTKKRIQKGKTEECKTPSPNRPELW